MARVVSLDFLIISTLPALTIEQVQAQLEPLRLGLVEATPEPYVIPDLPMPPGQERQRMGRIFVRETLARVDAALVVERHAHPLMGGLAPAALDRLALGLDAPHQMILRSGAFSVDVRATLHDADRAWGLQWAMALVERVAQVAQGVIFDPGAQRCLSPETLARQLAAGPIGQIALHNESWGPETRWLHTHGLQKFGQPELEIVAAPHALEAEAAAVLRTVAETLAAGDDSGEPVLRAGMQVECEGAGMLLARQAEPDADHRAPFGRLRLVTAPEPGAPARADATDVIIAAALRAALASLAAKAWQDAQRQVERILSAAPDHLATLVAQARLALAQGHPDAALEIGTYMTLRAPSDGRGFTVMGLALLAQGRLAEALSALTRAVALDPDDPDPFAARAQLYERLERLPEAAADRGRAKMLRG